MFRAKSSAALKLETPHSSPSATPSPQGTQSLATAYSAATYSADKSVSTYKKIKGQCIRCKYRLAAWAGNGEQLSQRLLFGVLLLLVVGLWALHMHMGHQATQSRHMVILDAGSTGTRVHVFRYSAGSSKSSYAVLHLPEPKLKVEPGLSAYQYDAAGAAASLLPLLQFAQQHVPAQQQAMTPVYLMATAGLRLLPAPAAEGILQQSRELLLASVFLFQPEWASIISGTSEGLYAWVAANYAAGHLQAAARNMRSRKEPRPLNSPFKALLELGGASAQVTFMPDSHWSSSSSSSSVTSSSSSSSSSSSMRGDSNSNSSSNSTQHGSSKEGSSLRVRLPGVSRPLWTHSFLGYGFDVVEQLKDGLVMQAAASAAAAGAGGAQGQLPQQQQPSKAWSWPRSPGVAAGQGSPAAGVMDPCLPAGYVAIDGRVGSGEWQQCQVLVAQAIEPSRCRAVAGKPCPVIPSRMPKLTGELLAIENFAYTAHALALPERTSLGDFALAARRFCSKPWPQTVTDFAHEPDQQRYLWRYCFGSAFAWTLLHDVLHLTEGQEVMFSNSLKSAEAGVTVGLDWALGAAVLLLSSSSSSSAEALLLKQQQQVQHLVLLAALVGTGALVAAVAIGLLREGGRKGRDHAQNRPGLREEGLEVVTSNGVWMYNPAAPAAGRQAYRALPISTRISE